MKEGGIGGMWWSGLLASGIQKQADLCEFRTSLVCRENSRTARAVHREGMKGEGEKKNNIVI